MCGIAGFFSPNHFFTEPDLRTMTQAIRHRGPDAEGIFTENFCGLGHRRLSILDLSDHANQPMHSADGRYVIAFNGEVYNFREIVRDLNLTPRTSSDTEVILEAFAQEGLVCVNRLNGMFAIALYDRHTQTLYLIRDHVGIKPVFYYWDGTQFAFASELKALTAMAQIPRQINHAAIRDFLHLGYIPAPRTIYERIYKMRPGAWLKITANGLEEHAYWKPEDQLQPSVIRDESGAVRQLDALLNDAVRQQLVSDVPLGVLLSGGIDSSLVAALAQQQSGTRINTFSIGFREQAVNESEYARAVATHIGTHHHEFIVSATDAQALVEPMLDLYDEPYADSSAIPTMLVSRLARQHVTVVLGGDGGDELFFGYGMYQWAERLANPALRLIRLPVSRALAYGKSARYQKASAMLRYPYERVHSPAHVFSQEQGYFSQREITDLLPSFAPNQRNSTYLLNKGELLTPSLRGEAGRGHLTPAEQQALFDLQYYLPDELLVKVDRASMYYGLEARVPLLDHRIVEFALNLSPDLKYRQGIRKYLLKHVLYNYVPARYFERPKQGFALPLAMWLRTDWRYLIEEYLSKVMVEQCGILPYSSVHQLKNQFLSGNNYVYHRLWLLVVVHRWMIKNTK